MDKLIEHLEFTSAVILIRHAAFFAGKEFGWSSLKAAMESGSHDSDTNGSQSSRSLSINEALLAFSTMDHASLLGLGSLDMEGMRRLCALGDGDELSEGVLLGGGGDIDGVYVNVDVGGKDGGCVGASGDVVAGGNAGGGVVLVVMLVAMWLLVVILMWMKGMKMVVLGLLFLKVLCTLCYP